ncbi:hypothetical protein BLNAU_16189 [Blattamonas nauphoetae]|uniref:Uncharacterized protein n=1 Tax=Blattamonas nauphoetae TaxID=2049346 RepID=A0ABQ9X8H0_9EUKA|nr:hypothetical protein BLNAU_16189 [Blattamonas nauphoetae]
MEFPHPTSPTAVSPHLADCECLSKVTTTTALERRPFNCPTNDSWNRTQTPCPEATKGIEETSLCEHAENLFVFDGHGMDWNGEEDRLNDLWQFSNPRRPLLPRTIPGHSQHDLLLVCADISETDESMLTVDGMILASEYTPDQNFVFTTPFSFPTSAFPKTIDHTVSLLYSPSPPALHTSSFPSIETYSTILPSLTMGNVSDNIFDSITHAQISGKSFLLRDVRSERQTFKSDMLSINADSPKQ